MCVRNLTDIEQTDIVIPIGTFDKTLKILDARLENMYQAAGVI
jgi:hypothetical protein